VSVRRQPITRKNTPETPVRRTATARKQRSSRRNGPSITLPSYIAEVQIALKRHLMTGGLLLELGVDPGVDDLVAAEFEHHPDRMSLDEYLSAAERIRQSLPEDLRSLRLRVERHEEARAFTREDVMYRVGLEVGRMLARGVV
jgi:hypothetical protein